MIGREEILNRVLKVFDRPVIQNNYRGLYAEALVAECLGKEWKQTKDWAGWDLEGPDGTKLEVKQSAAIQTWHEVGGARTSRQPAFSVRLATGRYEGTEWIEQEERPADAYVFAWHGQVGPDADQREPNQWRFIVASSRCLPNQKTITLNRLKDLFEEVSCAELPAAVERIKRQGENP